MRKENAFKKHILLMMGTRWHVQSHEDALSTGIPDLSFGVNGVNGWIELKHINKDDTKPQHFTFAQINWLRRRQKHGGNCFVFVKWSSKGYYLFHADDAERVALGTWDEHVPVKHWPGPICPDELIYHLTRGT